MTSKIGVKTYARQKMVCQPSSIQFDQLLDEKGNKPCAAKSKGTLHRWGMTSFTSLRNSQMNGRKEKSGGCPGGAEPKKRKPETVDVSDPFSFDAEPDGKKKTGRKADSAVTSSVESLDASSVTVAPMRTNKFFKSGSRSGLGKFGSQAQSRAVPLSNVVKQNLYYESGGAAVKSNPVVARDAFAELLLSAEVPGVAGVTPADMCLNAYPEVDSNMFSTFSPHAVRTYGAAPSNIIAHTFGYDQNFYHQPDASQNVIQNQVLFPVSTIPQTVIQPEVIFPCPIIQTPAQQPPPLPTDFSQTQMPILDGGELALGLPGANSSVVDVLDNGGGGNLVVESANVTADSFGKTSYTAEDDLFDSLRKSSSTYTSYPLHQERIMDPLQDVKVQPPAYHHDAESGHKVGEELKRDELLDDFSSDDSFMVINPDQQQQRSSSDDVPSSSQKVVFTASMIDDAAASSSSSSSSVPKKDDWGLSSREESLLNQPPPVASVCQTDVVVSHNEELMDTKLMEDETVTAPPPLPVESVKKEWELFSTDDIVSDVPSSIPSVSSTSQLHCSSTKQYKDSALTLMKSEPKSWEINYEPLAKPRLSSSLSFGGSSSKPYTSFSQRRIFNSPKKMDRKAVYKHRPWQADEEHEEEPPVESSKSIVDEFDEFENESSLNKPTLHRVVTWPVAGPAADEEAVTSVKCEKRFRDYYKVVRNVKQAHQCHESGETQEYNDDIEYLLESLQNTNSTGTRCLSLLSLASKCMAPAFRMHLRAHGALTKVFSALHDAPKQPNLALCTATVLFVLSQDRLNMDLERSSLDLMLQLLDTDGSMDVYGDSSSRHDREFDKNKEKVVDLCDELQKKGYAKHLDLDNITAGVLAMESLLSLTSKRAGEWFKEELRELGGLEHLVNTVCECGKCLPAVLVQLTDYALDKLRKLDRCLRVLENVTVMNTENQYYLINCQDSALIYYCARALQLCETCLEVYPTPDSSDKESPSWTLFSCLLSTMKVLLNLTNENCSGSAKVGEQEGFINSLLSCVLYLPSHLTVEQRFDVLVLSLGLLINLVEYCENNRKRLFFAEVSSPTVAQHRRFNGAIPAPKALVNLFLEHEDAARVEEAKTDKLLDGKGDVDAENTSNKDDSTTPTQNTVDDIEETLKKALQKAGKNMEDSMIAAYIALLLGCLIQNNKESAARIRDHLPNKSFDGMVQMLNKFLNFMTLTDIVGSTGMKSIKRVIDILENS